MNFYWLVPAIVFGYLVARFFAGKKTGMQGRIKSIFLHTKHYKIHLHHWLFSAAALLILISLNYYHDVVFGFLIGMIFQGLTYRDFYKIVYRKK